jgi:spore coat protein U-like protein
MLGIAIASSPANAACTGPTASATALAFGNYDPGTGTDVTANASLTVSCALVLENLPPFTVSLSQGASGSFSNRTLTFGGTKLNYNLYTDGTLLTVWGDGTSGSQTVSYNSGGRSVTLTVHGKLTKSQFVTPGIYSDTITATVTY